MLIIILCIGVSHKVYIAISFAFTVATLTRRIMLLPLCIAALLPLTSLLLIRLRVFSTIRVGIFDESRDAA